MRHATCTCTSGTRSCVDSFVAEIGISVLLVDVDAVLFCSRLQHNQVTRPACEVGSSGHVCTHPHTTVGFGRFSACACFDTDDTDICTLCARSNASASLTGVGDVNRTHFTLISERSHHTLADTVRVHQGIGGSIPCSHGPTLLRHFAMVDDANAAQRTK